MKLKQVWSSTKYSNRTKIRLFNSPVKSVLLYGCETSKMNESDNNKLDTFQFKCLRRILKIRWPYIVSKDDILSRTKVKRITTEVKIRRWRWIGHVLRMQNNCYCQTAMSWVPEGRRKAGRPRTTWRRTIEKERKQLRWGSWSQAKPIARNNADWREFTAALLATRPEEGR